MSNTKTLDQVDVRGPRFAAWITTAVLVITLLVSGVSPPAAAIILAVQSVVFAIGAVAGPRRHPYGLVFAKLVARRNAQDVSIAQHNLRQIRSCDARSGHIDDVVNGVSL